MAPEDPWCKLKVVAADGTSLASCTFVSFGPLDLKVVDGLARLALWARRAGVSLRLDEAGPGMRGLLQLAGLLVEMEGKSEGGEEALVVEQCQEEVHTDDPPT
jgi:hypothetical protein